LILITKFWYYWLKLCGYHRNIINPLTFVFDEL
jgi:hypothetical protein